MVVILYAIIDDDGFVNGFSDIQDNDYNVLFEIDEINFEELSACSGNCFKIENGTAVKKKDVLGYLSEWQIKRQKLERIELLKTKLSGSDYKAIKFAEGIISVEEYEVIREERQAWRDEINILESEIQGG